MKTDRQPPGHDHAHEPGSGHSHGLNADADRRYLVITLSLLGAFMLGEIIVAFVSGSLALLSDAGHMLSDVGAIAGALWAIRLSRPPGGRILDVRLEAG
jgi:cobalt-zinc-cadmium efflux system protein